ncbi:P2X purinoceptor 4-like [Paramacrobiotus metropolitanus]|uniref:P2X purinoceptor 4-like n=1 Tax=Paramacrobiotus metropolitanus TaxID=2943436 RepID=UPI0024455ECD|nr:P2X purinoceptor 4-like [Paramacrobiotus metropolitanus]XP_055332993.1 P2X purinoceptor 4-like [Paramacrobiotus metropolitanus]
MDVNSTKTNFVSRSTCRRFLQWMMRELDEFFFEYETLKVIKLYNLRIGLINRSIQICVLVSMIGYLFIYSKGYQAFYNGESTTVAKVKGLIKKNLSNIAYVWDTTDLVIPALENDATFVATNIVETAMQRAGRCADKSEWNNRMRATRCRADADCMQLLKNTSQLPTSFNGFLTGKCIVEDLSCEIDGWCPAEIDKPPEPPLFLDAGKFTILVKNYVSFPDVDVKRRNILESISEDDLRNCRYDRHTDPYCPVFLLKDIVRLAQENFTEIARTGAILGFHINWECNLDYHERHCLPKYEFRRMDSAEKVAEGWSFRHAHYWTSPSGEPYRMLQKYYGIRINYKVQARAGKFDVVTCAMNVGSAVGLFGIATILCDFITMHVSKNPLFRSRKVEKIRMDRAATKNKLPLPENGTAQAVERMRTEKIFPITPDAVDFLLKKCRNDPRINSREILQSTTTPSNV